MHVSEYVLTMLGQLIAAMVVWQEFCIAGQFGIRISRSLIAQRKRPEDSMGCRERI